MGKLAIISSIAAAGLAMALPCAEAQTRFRTLYNFTASPVGLSAFNGALYGVELAGCGLAFQLQPPAPESGGEWTETVIHSFGGPNDGCDPIDAPVVGSGGSLYGATYIGGAYNYGAFYELQPPPPTGGAWTESVLYSFGGPAQNGVAALPATGLVAGPAGSFYFLTPAANADELAQLVQLRPPAVAGTAWTASVLYAVPQLGGAPATSLSAGANGVLYGTTSVSGVGGGLIFQLTPPPSPGGTWTAAVLYDLDGRQQGSHPNAVTLGSDGSLYGSARRTPGTAFQLSPPASPGGSWTFTLLKDFEGDVPDTPLVLRDGNLFGALLPGPGRSGGLLFELAPPSSPGGVWTTTYLHQFTTGQGPDGSLVIDGQGTLYGTTAHFYTSGTVYAVATK